MPTYQYACTACGARHEAVQSFTDAHLTDCPTCGGLLRKVWAYVGEVPSIVWLLLVGAGLSWLAWNAFRSMRLITQSVQSGARQ